MKYYNSKLTSLGFDEAIEKVTGELKNEGFGILTEIDVTSTLKKKLDVDFRKYRILGACNPPFAHKAISAEANIGVLLPCNVVVQEENDGQIRVSVVNPMVSMQNVDNPALSDIAAEVSSKLDKVLEKV